MEGEQKVTPHGRAVPTSASEARAGRGAAPGWPKEIETLTISESPKVKRPKSSTVALPLIPFYPSSALASSAVQR